MNSVTFDLDIDSMLLDLAPQLAEFYDGNPVRYRFLRTRSGSEWSESAGSHTELDAEIDALDGERPTPLW